MPKKAGYDLAKSFLKRAAIGGGIGYAASRTTSSSDEAPVNARSGALVGALTYAFAPSAAKKLKTSRAGQAVRGTARKGKFIFRKIKGRIVPIKV